MYRQNRHAVIFRLSIVALCTSNFLLTRQLADGYRLPSPSDLFSFISQTGGFKAVLVSLIGEDFSLNYLEISHGFWAFFSFVAIAIALAVFYVKKGLNRKGVLVASSLYFFVALILLTGITRPDQIAHFIHDGFAQGNNRYFVIPSFLCILILIQIASEVFPLLPRRVGGVALALLLLLYLAPVKQNFYYRISDPKKYNWKRDVTAYYRVAVGGSDVKTGARAWKIVIFPGGRDWRVSLPPQKSFSQDDRSRIKRILVSADSK